MKVIITNINWTLKNQSIAEEFEKGILTRKELFNEANTELKSLPDEIAIFLPTSATIEDFYKSADKTLNAISYYCEAIGYDCEIA